MYICFLNTIPELAAIVTQSIKKHSLMANNDVLNKINCLEYQYMCIWCVSSCLDACSDSDFVLLYV